MTLFDEATDAVTAIRAARTILTTRAVSTKMPRTKPVLLVVLAFAATTLVSCGDSRSRDVAEADVTPMSTAVEMSRSSNARPTAVASSSATPHAPFDDGAAIGSRASEPAVAASVNHLAEDLAIAPEDVSLMSVEAKEWTDSGLGCPQADMFYLQVITPGYRIVLEVDDEQAVYHTDSANPPNVVRCDP